jgi:hypothetical protein
MGNAKELVIFTQTHDLLTWLLPQCDRFPKAQRLVVTQRLQGALLDFQEAIFEANARDGMQPLQHLQSADAHLNKLRLYLRLARQWDWLRQRAIPARKPHGRGRGQTAGWLDLPDAIRGQPGVSAIQ